LKILIIIKRLISERRRYRYLLPCLYELGEEADPLLEPPPRLLCVRRPGIVQPVNPAAREVIRVELVARRPHLTHHLVVRPVRIKIVQQPLLLLQRRLPPLQPPHLHELREVEQRLRGLRRTAVHVPVPLLPVGEHLPQLGVRRTRGGGDHHPELPLGQLHGEVHRVRVPAVVVREHEPLHAVLRQAADGVHQHVQQGHLAERYRPPEPHVVRRVPRPAGMHRQAVRPPRHLLHERPGTQRIHPKRQVGTMLLNTPDPDHDHRRRLILQPVLESRTRQLMKPEPTQNTPLRQR